MKAHVSSILLGVQDMERSKRFYTEGLGWEVQNDYKISVFFVPHGGSLVGFYGRDGLAGMVGASPEGSGFSGVVFNYVVRSEGRVDEVLDEAKKAGGKILKPRGGAGVGRVRRFVRRPGRLHLEHRLQRPGEGPALRGVARQRCCVDPRASGGGGPWPQMRRVRRTG
jgi:predicted enzyme related to lactoylglutathione lyase